MQPVFDDRNFPCTGFIDMTHFFEWLQVLECAEERPERGRDRIGARCHAGENGR